MRRLFTALEVPADAASALTGLQGGVPDARWIDAHSFHITLRYIGPVDEPAARDIAAALNDGAVLAGGGTGQAFGVALAGVGQFGKSRPRALWAGVERNTALEALYGAIDRALVRLGLPDERKRYTPHVTLARLKGASMDAAGRRSVKAWLEAHALFRTPSFEAAGFTLFSSRPAHGGSPYIREQVYELGGEG